MTRSVLLSTSLSVIGRLFLGERLPLYFEPLWPSCHRESGQCTTELSSTDYRLGDIFFSLESNLFWFSAGLIRCHLRAINLVPIESSPTGVPPSHVSVWCYIPRRDDSGCRQTGRSTRYKRNTGLSECIETRWGLRHCRARDPYVESSCVRT
jgi:hypothetical protein